MMWSCGRTMFKQMIRYYELYGDNIIRVEVEAKDVSSTNNRRRKMAPRLYSEKNDWKTSSRKSEVPLHNGRYILNPKHGYFSWLTAGQGWRTVNWCAASSVKSSRSYLQFWNRRYDVGINSALCATIEYALKHGISVLLIGLFSGTISSNTKIKCFKRARSETQIKCRITGSKCSFLLEKLKDGG